jgi:Domain of unknown function (DUF5668)/B-box zinc finger
MNCANHPETAAISYCRTCGKPLCQICEKPAQGTVFCQEHEPPPVAANPYTAPPPSPYAAPYTPPVVPNAPSPGLAFVLGLIPGVGAIYNGQYAKGLVHVIILGLLISILGNGGSHGLEPLFGLLTMLFFFYMAFEAYHTAAKRQRGEEVDEFSSLFPMGRRSSGLPIGPLLIILAGVIFLLDTLDLLRLYQVIRYWPVFLILLGCYMLYVRLRSPEVSSER